jgi:hypothetical protein
MCSHRESTGGHAAAVGLPNTDASNGYGCKPFMKSMHDGHPPPPNATKRCGGRPATLQRGLAPERGHRPHLRHLVRRVWCVRMPLPAAQLSCLPTAIATATGNTLNMQCMSCDVHPQVDCAPQRVPHRPHVKGVSRYCGTSGSLPPCAHLCSGRRHLAWQSELEQQLSQ